MFTGEPNSQLLIAACISAGLVFSCLVLAVWAISVRLDPVLKRLDGLSGSVNEKQMPFKVRLRRFLASIFSRLSKPAQPKQNWEIGRLRKELVAAGFRHSSALSVFVGSRVFCALLYPIFVLISPLRLRLDLLWFTIALVLAGALGYITPNIYLNIKGRRRREQIQDELPQALDLLVISVEAGLGLDAALKRVAKEIKVSSPLLASEFGLVGLELNAGIPRDMALKNLAMRCNVDEVSSLVSMLIQADRFGVSVGRSLRVHSDTVRTKRRQKAEEAAAKVPLKLLFPVLFLIFPAIMVVMAGPAIIRVSEHLFTK